MEITRRAMMRDGAMALIGTASIPSFLKRTVYASEISPRAKKQVMVVLFQRGAADGLNIVIPHAESYYYKARTSIAIPQSQVLDLDGFFGLHPALSELKPLWDRKELAIIHATGSPDPSRSHFDAQDYMESGTPGYRATADGWMNRALQAQDERDHRIASPFRSVSVGSSIALTMRGRVPTVAIGDVTDFGVDDHKPDAARVSDAFRSMYAADRSSRFHGTATETFEAIRMLKATNPAQYRPSNGAQYPRSAFGDSMKQIAQLIKADLGVEVAFADIGGWDHHVNEGGAEGQLARSLRDLSQGIGAFWQDMGSSAENVTVVTMSEFGRTVHQNGTGGTDHGHANVMFLLGGQVKGGEVYGPWPGLEPENLYQGRDLAIGTDYRTVLGEAIWKNVGARDMNRVFPNAKLDPQRFLNYLPTPLS
ncbi:MAG: DUF1501 domain-containing protein [Acidobacteria bacterium]|nr:DUF1501 domain-containing protein [Acidobacteriota bacterium]